MAKKFKRPRNNDLSIKIPRRFLSMKLSIILVCLVLALIFAVIEYAYNTVFLSRLHIGLSSDFITNTEVYKNAVKERDYSNLKDDLNKLFGNEATIKYLVVTDAVNIYDEKYSSFNDDKFSKKQDENDVKPYIYAVEDKASSFTLNTAADLDISPKLVQNIYINDEQTNVNFQIGLTKSNYFSNFTSGIERDLLVCFGILFLLSFIISYALASSITKHLSEIEETVFKMGRGDLSKRLEYTNYKEINNLIYAYNMMANALQRLYSSLEAQVNDRTKKLNGAYTELKSTQAMMVHSEKMKSLGELVAGIMHEINNPINFIYGNMTHLSNYSNDLINIIDSISQMEELPENVRNSINTLKKDADYDFLKSDMPDLIKSCKEGADRAKNIIQDLKSFSRTGEAAITDVDIVSEIDTTLNILHNKIKNKVEIHKEYIDYVPKIEAFGGQLNQVFMNILDNAIGAIKDNGDIWIRIKTDENYNKLIIEVEDNGVGMDNDILAKVFDPFFTTKPVGQGTGLGLSITHKIIRNHQGDIQVSSVKGEGTKFVITLPINLDREQLPDRLLDKGANE